MRELLSTDHFVWLHVPKTGGTWLHRILVERSPPSWRLVGKLPSHVRLAEVPAFLEAQGVPERNTLPRIATIRNPWDRYVSVYFWMEGHYVKRTGGFAPPPSEWSRECAMWARDLSNGLTIDGFRRAARKLIEADHSEIGVTSQQEAFVMTDEGKCGGELVRFEELRLGFLETISRVVPSVTEAMKQAILLGAPDNSSVHPHYTDCYNDELKQLVAARRGALIEMGKYVFERRTGRP